MGSVIVHNGSADQAQVLAEGQYCESLIYSEDTFALKYCPTVGPGQSNDRPLMQQALVKAV